MIEIECPHCREALSLPDSLAGEIETCPTCRTEFRVPLPAAPSIPTFVAPPALPHDEPRQSVTSSRRRKIILTVVVAVLIAGVSLVAAVRLAMDHNRAKLVQDPHAPADVRAKADTSAREAYVKKAQPLLERLERTASDVEVGVNISEYSASVRDLHFQAKQFSEKLTAAEKANPSARYLMLCADSFETAADCWKYQDIVQRCWARSGQYRRMATECLRGDEHFKPFSCTWCKGTGKADPAQLVDKTECPICFGYGDFREEYFKASVAASGPAGKK